MIQNPIVRLLFNRGGIGTSMSRAETIEHINPIIEQHMRLNRSYNYVIDHASEGGIIGRLKEMQKKARADVGKLSETVLSAGGAAYTGVDLRDETFDLGGDNSEMLFQLLDFEQSLYDAVTEELGLNHHLRTQAILENVQRNSKERLGYLKATTKSRPRRATAS